MIRRNDFPAIAFQLKKSLVLAGSTTTCWWTVYTWLANPGSVNRLIVCGFALEVIFIRQDGC